MVFRFTNVATIQNETFSASTTVSISKETGLFISPDAPAIEIDASGYILLPERIQSTFIFTGRSVAQGTTVAVVANFSDSTKDLDQHKLPLVVEYDVKSGEADSFTSSNGGSLQLNVSPFSSSLAGMVEGSLFASGLVGVSETPSVWPYLREQARQLSVVEYNEAEDSKLAVGLRDLLARVTQVASKQLKLEGQRGVIEEGAVADFILVKLDPEWIVSTVGILLPLFLSPSASTRIHSVFTRGTMAYTLQNSTIAQSLAAATLSKFYATPNLPALSVTAATTSSKFNTIPEAIAAIKKGEFVIVVDNEDRENEGDFIIAAEDCTEEKMAFMIRYSSGVICVPMKGSRLDELNLPLMVENNEDSLKTAYTISVDYKHGTTTGISSHDRSKTLIYLANPTTSASDFSRPGHIFPLRAHENGVLSRVGHTEASIDLCVLAGKQPCAGISEIVLDQGGMARRDDLLEMGRRWGLCVVTIDALVKYRVENNV
ncbi:UNVERIFIED_CONTAM: hypothetical protein HDU68_001478 [Siphonaria sp. JEL0065]|nr:hypothetical protein HDU68_001478 [Siphonaria sp. JEL0065]